MTVKWILTVALFANKIKCLYMLSWSYYIISQLFIFISMIWLFIYLLFYSRLFLTVLTVLKWVKLLWKRDFWEDLVFWHKITAVRTWGTFQTEKQYQENTAHLCQNSRLCYCFQISHPAFQRFLPTLTPADIMYLWSWLRGWAKEGAGGGKMCWSLQLGGDLDQMVASLLQMHFNFPYPPLAHSRTVNR